MLLIIILILSQDKGFSQNVQEVMLGSVPWYKERMLQKTSLGDLCVYLPAAAGCYTHVQVPLSVSNAFCVPQPKGNEAFGPVILAICDLHVILPTKHVPVLHERRHASS